MSTQPDYEGTGALGGVGTAAAVTVSHLRKTYGATVAVDDVSFSVERGEIFGILGPNGAGKTTTVECVIGLRAPDAGTMRAPRHRQVDANWCRC
ncbi:MAG TPA: ATP-binding cassette domain-containing protein [Acidimicrobiales bacterium]|nr:ATP-binding cassette domain-containing protein [Acidimicrobiales bacterium]